MAINTQQITLEAFVDQYGDNGPFEYIDGEFVPVAPQVIGSGRMGGELYFLIKQHIRSENLREVFIETPFVITLDRSRWVTGSRVPDVMFYSATRFKQFTEAYPDWQSIPAVGAPDFVAEIVSPTDRFSEVSGKVARYLDDGVKLVWVLDRQAQTIQVHTQGSNQIITYTGEISVSAEPVIPGFTLDLAHRSSPYKHVDFLLSSLQARQQPTKRSGNDSYA